MRGVEQRAIEVWADWAELGSPRRMGVLYATPARSKEVFSFEYDSAWLKGGQVLSLDPSLQLFAGKQYPASDQKNFGLFLDSSPDRWGRKLMERCEAQVSRAEGRPERPLHESDYLLGVYDGHRMGALRFRLDAGGPFLDDNSKLASPPWTSLRDLEYASLQIERRDAEEASDYGKWLRALIAPGGSLGGARPKAGVLDERGRLWIAKFPSRNDDYDVGAWEYLVYQLGRKAGITGADAMVRRFNTDHHTFLTERFDRMGGGGRRHFASAMTLLGYSDGDDASAGVSYLEIAEFIVQQGARPTQDLEQLWRRIVFSICVTNVDDHLRNHGFILEPEGWRLSPAYDINPVRSGDGLKLNISETDNALDLELAREVSEQFRVRQSDADAIITEVVTAVKDWRGVASELKMPQSEQDRMGAAFRAAEDR